MSSRLIRPVTAGTREIRCNVGDVMVANLAIHFVLFFERRLDSDVLARAFAHALDAVPIFAGRLGMAGGRMRIRCGDNGVPFTTASSDRTLTQAIHSAARDEGLWLVDPVNGVVARWGWGPLFTVRITHLSDGATAVGVSFHHAVGDMRTFMLLMNAWSAAASDRQIVAPLLVDDRAAYLDRHLPPDTVRQPGVRCLRMSELAVSALYLAKDARKQRTFAVYFADDEIARMRDAYTDRMWLSANDVVCAHICEALVAADRSAQRRSLAITVDVRRRCGLDPDLAGNMITTLRVEIRRGDTAQVIAERIRKQVEQFTEQHCDLRANQRFLDGVGWWRGAWCVSTAFDPRHPNPLITNLSGFGVYRLRFGGAAPRYFTMLLKLPVAGLGALVEGEDGRGLLFQMSLPPRDFDSLTRPATLERLHRFRRDDDDIPPLHCELPGF